MDSEPTTTVGQVKEAILRKRVHFSAVHLEERLQFGAKQLKSEQLQDYATNAGSQVLVQPQHLHPQKIGFKRAVGKAFKSIVMCGGVKVHPNEKDCLESVPAPKTSIEVFVETSNGTCVGLVIGPTDSLARLKQAIETETNVSADEQSLFLNDDASSALDDDEKTLDSYGIESGSTIVQTYAPKADLQIVVETSRGHSFVLHVKRSDQVELIKREIERRDRIASDEQQLVLAGERLENERTLGSYDIGTGSTLFQALVPCEGFQVSIETSKSHVYSVRVKASTTIADVKQAIFERDQINPDNQRLYSSGQTLATDEHTLGSYQIRPGATIVQGMNVRITLESSSWNKWKFDVDPAELIDRVKAEIQRREDILVDRQRLMFDDEELKPGTRLNEYNISSGDTIRQLLHANGPILVFINTSRGKLHQFHRYQFQPWDTVLHVKKIIFSLETTPVAEQEILLNGSVLLDDKTLESYGVKDRTYIVQRLRASCAAAD